MPHQTLVPTVMLELVSESVLTGDEKGEDIIILAPGLQLWHPESNWKVRIGVGFPLTSDRENDFAVYFQFWESFRLGTGLLKALFSRLFYVRRFPSRTVIACPPT